MALFEPHLVRATAKRSSASDAATRALSVTVVENDFVAGVYENIAWFYDMVFGPALHPGRVDAIERMGIKAGDRVLEVGVGTGINAALYPSRLRRDRHRFFRARCSRKRTTASRARASATCGCCRWTRRRTELRRRQLRHRLRAVRDQRRPRPGRGRRARCAACAAPAENRHPEPLPQQEPHRRVARADHLAVHAHIGFKSDLDLPAFLAQANLKPVSIEKVNVPRIWSLVTCVKE